MVYTIICIIPFVEVQLRREQSYPAERILSFVPEFIVLNELLKFVQIARAMMAVGMEIVVQNG